MRTSLEAPHGASPAARVTDHRPRVSQVAYRPRSPPCPGETSAHTSGSTELLPKCASTENYASRVVMPLAEVRERKKRRRLAELRAEQAARHEARADEWRRALASG